MFGTTTQNRENVKDFARGTSEKVALATRNAREYAVEHKAVTVAGVVALGAIGLAIYALMKRNGD